MILPIQFPEFLMNAVRIYLTFVIFTEVRMSFFLIQLEMFVMLQNGLLKKFDPFEYYFASLCF